SLGNGDIAKTSDRHQSKFRWRLFSRQLTLGRLAENEARPAIRGLVWHGNRRSACNLHAASATPCGHAEATDADEAEDGHAAGFGSDDSPACDLARPCKAENVPARIEIDHVEAKCASKNVVRGVAVDIGCDQTQAAAEWGQRVPHFGLVQLGANDY